MKLLIIVLIISADVMAQIDSNLIRKIEMQIESADIMSDNLSGVHDYVYCNSISAIRNVRAIGLQETKIYFYYIQKEDSVYESEENTFFIPLYSPPIKVRIDYNIAASQNVSICYYFNDLGSLIHYRSISEGAYGYEKILYWFDNNALIKALRSESPDIQIKNGRTGVPGLEDIKASDKILSRAEIYLKEYYNIFELEQADK